MSESARAGSLLNHWRSYAADPVDTPAGAPEPPEAPLPTWLQTLLFARFRHRMLPIMRRRYGDVFTVRLAPHHRKMVMLSNPADIRAAFSGPSEVFRAGEGNGILGPVMGKHSVLLLDEAAHRRIRKLLMPAFHGEALCGYRALIIELTNRELDRWPSGRTFGVHGRMQKLTLEIILQVVFGVTDADRLRRLRPLVDAVVGIKPLIILGWFYPRLRKHGPWLRFGQTQRALDELLYAEIAERRTATDLATRTDVLSMLLRGSADSGESPLTDAEVRDNLITLLLAGHETTATALAWAFHDLARQRGLQQRTQEAADEGDDAWLEAVAKESMRLHPVVYEVARKLTAPVTIGGFTIAARATVMPTIGLVHADGQHWSDPKKFDPARHLGVRPAANTWIPFGGGGRRCLGAGFALLEATAVIGEVAKRFDLAPDRRRTEGTIYRNVTLAPARGVRLRVARRSRS